MEFYYYIPKKLSGLAPLIWEQKSNIAQNWSFLPEFNIDLIFNLGQPWKIYNQTFKEKAFNPTANFCFLSGLHTQPINVRFPFAHMFGIRLNTVAASILFQLPCKELKNWAIEGDVIFKDKLNHIQDKICSIKGFYERALWLEDFVCTLIIHQSDFKTAKEINALLIELSNKKLKGKANRIEDFTGYSRMHTLRLFHKWFGTTPSEALAFKRFEASLNQIHYSDQSLTQIALNCGFYDQAHFIRVFNKFAEMTPGQYVKQKTEIVGQLSF